ncbi:hypothetical protein GQ53DRAFT_8767 [Thozetella sp. PMI_491]|nr:hypothetical protein GQ53DRAFT_8767 [Thozetella sp. PMI_491]
MGRWSHYDTDEERLPEGMTRIGYDADEQTYTYRDADGSIWESAPGNQYGPLTRVSGPPQTYDRVHDDDDPAIPPPYEVAEPKVSWRADMMPLFNFFLIIGLILIGVYYFLGPSSGKAANLSQSRCAEGDAVHKIHSGDTCWKMAESQGVTLDALRSANEGLDCDRLKIGSTVCIPRA